MQRQQGQGRTRAGLFLVGSLFLAVLAAGLVFKVVRDSQAKIAAAQKPNDLVDVVVAQRDLYMGLPIGTDDVIVRRVAAGMVPDEVTFAALDDVVGRTPRSLILANEAIRMERLARPDAGIGLNAVVEPGKRAMTVATDTEDAVAGLLQPGNYVDIIVTIKPEEGTIQAKWATDTILQGIKVLAVGGSISQAPLDEQQARIASNKPQEPTESKTDTKTKKRASQQDVMRRMKPSITLEVTPEDAERLALAVDQGEIHVVLRSDIDILHYEDNALITSKELIGLPPGEVAPDPLPKRRDAVEVPPVPTGPTAVVIQGSNKTDVALNPDGSVQTENTQKRKKNR